VLTAYRMEVTIRCLVVVAKRCMRFPFESSGLKRDFNGNRK